MISLAMAALSPHIFGWAVFVTLGWHVHHKANLLTALLEQGNSFNAWVWLARGAEVGEAGNL